MRFLLDENLSPLHVRTVCGLGHEAISVAPGVVRHPATEGSIDTMLLRAIPRLTGIDVRGKLAVVDQQKIRIRG